MLLLIVSANTWGQHRIPIDSLFQLLNTSANDAARVMLLYEISNEYVENCDSAILIGKQGVELAKKINDQSGEAWCYSAIGGAYYFQHDYSTALNFFLKSLEIGDKINDQKLKGNVFNYLGLIYTGLKSDSLALYYFNRSIQIAKEQGDSMRELYAMGNICRLYVDTREYHKALECLYTELEMEKALNDKYGMATSLGNIGDAYYHLDSINKSTIALQQALELAQSINNQRIIAGCLILLSRNYIAHNIKSKSILYADSALKIAKQINDREVIDMASTVLVEVYEKSGDFENALHYYRVGRVASDSIFNVERLRMFNDLKTKYEIDKRQSQIEILEKDKKLAKSQAVMFGGGFFIVFFISVFVYRNHKKTKTLNVLLEKQKSEIKQQADLLTQANQSMEIKVTERTRELEAERKKSVMALLVGQETERQRIAKDLHDSLNIRLIGLKRTIEMFSSNKKESIVTEIDSIIGQVREVSHDLMPYSLKHYGLVHALDDLSQKLKEQHGFIVNFTTYNVQLDSRWNEIIETEIFRVVQEVVANVIKHAQATSINIEFIADKEVLLLSIEDNGKGFIYEDKPRNGIGLKNIHARVSLMGGTFSYDSEINKGTIVMINIPIT